MTKAEKLQKNSMSSNWENDHRSPLSRGLSSVDQDFWFCSKELGTEHCMGYKVDMYGGIILDHTTLPNDVDTFCCIFEGTLQHLKQIGFQKGFWMRIPISKIEFVPICVKEFGFALHHARCDYVMLVKWTHPVLANPIPRQSSHQVCAPVQFCVYFSRLEWHLSFYDTTGRFY